MSVFQKKTEYIRMKKDCQVLSGVSEMSMMPNDIDGTGYSLFEGAVPSVYLIPINSHRSKFCQNGFSSGPGRRPFLVFYGVSIRIRNKMLSMRLQLYFIGRRSAMQSAEVNSFSRKKPVCHPPQGTAHSSLCIVASDKP